METYKDAIELFYKSQAPKKSNIISLHHFFNVKCDGESKKIKLKCRLVTHTNRDLEKNKISSGSSTAQFLIFWSVLSVDSN